MMLNIPLNKQAGGIACPPSLVVEPRLDAARALAAVDDVGRQVGALVHPRRVRLRADVLHPAVTHLVLRQVGREQKVPQLVAETAEEGRKMHSPRRLCLNSHGERGKRSSPSGKISKFARRQGSCVLSLLTNQKQGVCFSSSRCIER